MGWCVVIAAKVTVEAIPFAGLVWLLAGGVASNSRLREDIKRMCKENDIQLYYPSPVLCTDNGAMIGSAAFYTLMQGKISDIDLNAFATGGLDEFYRK